MLHKGTANNWPGIAVLRVPNSLSGKQTLVLGFKSLARDLIITYKKNMKRNTLLFLDLPLDNIGSFIIWKRALVLIYTIHDKRSD